MGSSPFTFRKPRSPTQGARRTIVVAVAIVLFVACGGRSVSTLTVVPTVPTAVPETLPAPTLLGLGTFSNGFPAALGWQQYPDPEAAFELQWRFQDVGLWQDMGTAPPASTDVGGQPGIVAYRGNHATYCYRVRTVKGDLVSAWSEELCQRIRAGEPHLKLQWAPPVFGPSLSYGSVGVEVSWQPMYEEFRDRIQFEVWRRDKESPVYETIAAVPGIHSRFIDPHGTLNSCYRIRAGSSEIVWSVSPETCLATAE